MKKIILLSINTLICFTLLSCEDKQSEDSNITSKAVTLTDPVIEQKSTLKKLATGFKVECIIWCARGREQIGGSKDISTPMLELSKRWVSWSPDGTILPGR